METQHCRRPGGRCGDPQGALSRWKLLSQPLGYRHLGGPGRGDQGLPSAPKAGGQVAGVVWRLWEGPCVGVQVRWGRVLLGPSLSPLTPVLRCLLTLRSLSCPGRWGWGEEGGTRMPRWRLKRLPVTLGLSRGRSSSCQPLSQNLGLSPGALSLPLQTILQPRGLGTGVTGLPRGGWRFRHLRDPGAGKPTGLGIGGVPCSGPIAARALPQPCTHGHF